MARELVSIEVSKAWKYITEFTPSAIIPFKGNFPLLPPYKIDDFSKGIEHIYLDECEDWIQDLVVKGVRMQSIEEGFREYLDSNGITDKFNEMKSADKATELVRFLDAHSLTFKSLEIK